MSSQDTPLMMNNTDAYRDLGLENAQALEAELTKNKQDMTTHYFRHCQLLYHVRKDRLFEDLGFSSWDDFCEKHEQMTRRNANYMVELWGKVKDYRPERIKELSEIGISKARMVLKVVGEDDNDYDRWIEKARMSNCDALDAVVSMQRKKKIAKEVSEQTQSHDEGAPSCYLNDSLPLDEKFQNLNFRLAPGQYSVAVKALDIASRIMGSSKIGHNLTMICGEFVATHGGSEGLVELLSTLEASLELTIVAVKDKTGEVVYGKGSLEEVAQCSE